MISKRIEPDRDVAFLCVQIDRYDGIYDDLSASHYMPFFGADVYAVQAPPQFHSKDNKQVMPIQTIRFFDRRSLKVKPINSGLINSDKILEDTVNEDRDYIKEILENREEVNTDQRKYRTLLSISRFHELHSSTLEFEGLRKLIDERSTKIYIDEKSSLKPALAQIRRQS